MNMHTDTGAMCPPLIPQLFMPPTPPPSDLPPLHMPHTHTHTHAHQGLPTWALVALYLSCVWLLTCLVLRSAADQSPT